MYYDPMIAKLVTHAPTREKAIAAQADALDAFYIDGIQHNIPFLQAVMQHPRWISGKISTGFIKEEYPDGFKPRAAEGEERRILAAVAAVIDHQQNSRRRQITHQMSGTAVSFAKTRVVKIGDDHLKMEVAGENHSFAVTMIGPDGARAETVSIVSSWTPGQPVWHGKVNNRDVAIMVRPLLNGLNLSYRGITVPVHVFTTREAELAALMPVKVAADMSKFLLCPMPGLVKSINVEE